jgi:hypothetical protein
MLQQQQQLQMQMPQHTPYGQNPHQHQHQQMAMLEQLERENALMGGNQPPSAYGGKVGASEGAGASARPRDKLESKHDMDMRKMTFEIERMEKEREVARIRQEIEAEAKERVKAEQHAEFVEQQKQTLQVTVTTIRPYIRLHTRIHIPLTSCPQWYHPNIFPLPRPPPCPAAHPRPSVSHPYHITDIETEASYRERGEVIGTAHEKRGWRCATRGGGG